MALCRQQICLHAPSLSRAFQLFALSFEEGIFVAFGLGRLTRDPSVLRYHHLKIKPLLSSAMVFNQIGQPRQRVSLHGAFSELDTLSSSKTRRPASLMLPAFSNRGTSPGSKTPTTDSLLGLGSETVTHRPVLKQVRRNFGNCSVQ